MFDKWFYMVMAILGGIMISPQGAINAILGRSIGKLQAGIVSFAVGFSVLLISALLLSKKYPGSWGRVIEVPPYAFLGGVMGAIIVLTTLLAVPKIGATPTLMGILIGQVVISIFMDRFGWFGLTAMPFEPLRLVGLALLLAALPLVLR